MTCTLHLQSVQLPRWSQQNLFKGTEDANMPRVKQASKRKRVTKAVPVLGAAGLSFSLAGGAAAAVPPPTDIPRNPNIAPSHKFKISEKENFYIRLATFYIFYK